MGAPDEWPSWKDLANTRQAGVGLPPDRTRLTGQLAIYLSALVVADA